MPAWSHTCTYCSKDLKNRILVEHGSVYAIEDLYPVTQGHILIIPFYHTLDYYTMTDEERRDAQQLLGILKKRIMAHDSSVYGFNVGINCGEIDGQLIQHAHIHLIPRREGAELFNKPFYYLR